MSLFSGFNIEPRKVEKAAEIPRLQVGVSQLQERFLWRHTGFIFWVSLPKHLIMQGNLWYKEKGGTLKCNSRRHHLHSRRWFQQSWAIGRETDGEMRRETMCKLFSHFILGLCVSVCVCIHSAGVVTSSQKEARLMTVLRWDTITCLHATDWQDFQVKRHDMIKYKYLQFYVLIILSSFNYFEDHIQLFYLVLKLAVLDGTSFWPACQTFEQKTQCDLLVQGVCVKDDHQLLPPNFSSTHL